MPEKIHSDNVQKLSRCEIHLLKIAKLPLGSKICLKSSSDAAAIRIKLDLVETEKFSA